MTRPAPLPDDPLEAAEGERPDIDAIALRRPDVPTTLADLAARKADGIEIIEARGAVLATARKIGLRLTGPPDWVLFRAPTEHGGQVVGYLQDAGADRVRDVTGIEIFDVSVPEKVVGAEPGQFHYIVRGSGRCKLTDDFVRGKTGIELELLIRKAARANLDGNLVRELAGMKAVPVEDLEAAWVGTHKKVDQCRKGRGFGTAAERLGARKETAPNIDPPICPHCKTPGKYRPAKGDRGAFWGCENWDKHRDQKWTVDAEEWLGTHRVTTAPTKVHQAPPASE
jgi:hypothetical protein